MANPPAHGQVDNGDILGLTGTGADNAGEAHFPRGIPGGFGFSQRAALVWLDQHGIGGTDNRRAAHTCGIRHQEIIPHHLDAPAYFAGEGGKTRRVIFGQRVFDGRDRIGRDPAKQHADHLIRAQFTPFQAKLIAPAFTEIRRGNIKRDRHLPARRKTRFFDGGYKGFQSLFIGGEGRPPAAFIGDPLQQPALLHDGTGGAIDFGGPIERLGKAGRGRAHDQKVLDIHAPPGMGAAAENLDLRQRQ